MNTLTRWNQLKELEALRQGLAGMFTHSPVRLPGGQEESLAVTEWSPLVDISEDDKEYLIKAELAGVKKEDVSPNKVSAEFKDGVLTVHLVKDEKAKPQEVQVKIS